LKILFDQGTPAPLRRAFGAHTVETAFERHWDNLKNGALIEAAEAAGFDVFVTTDKNLWYQQNLRARRIAILVLWTTSWPDLRLHAETISEVVSRLAPGEFRELSRPSS
jgi:hypothetical protein